MVLLTFDKNGKSIFVSSKTVKNQFRHMFSMVFLTLTKKKTHFFFQKSSTIHVVLVLFFLWLAFAVLSETSHD